MTNSDLQQNQQSIIKLVQELLLDIEDRLKITPTLIDQTIDQVVGLKPKWGADLDRKAVADELIRRFSVWVGQDTTLRNEAGHVAWLTVDRKKEWRYWQRYREYMERSLPLDAIAALDRSTDAVLALLEDPVREDPWDRRGLVVGHVQSGKTANYTGLICKAADAGYKLIIVLAGLHNNLRAQTQIRLDEGFLGYETKPSTQDLERCGVGEIDRDNEIRPNYATNRSERGDFSTAVARNLGITPEQRPWLFVVKKNKSVLEKLQGWITNRVANFQHPQTGRKVVTNLPLLLIDDEADHASVDTGEQLFDGDGLPDMDHEPKAINRLIRRILHSFSRSAYVGYTATPFANIFIHERGETTEEGPDLFPAAFIINLAAPSNYVGPTRVFGLRTQQERQGGLPLIRRISDQTPDKDGEVWIPKKHNKDHRPRYQGSQMLPPSLVEAIDAFLLGCAARRLRGDARSHASMLIHVTRFNAVQREVFHQVDKHVQHLRQTITRGIGYEPAMARLQSLWEGDFLAHHPTLRAECPNQVPIGSHTWEQIRDVLPDALVDIKVKMVNGTAKDALDYADNKSTGLKVIAIGGDKLARGLTLEGLCVSYFLRSSKMYDTLMQMGRWFGYRPGYLDISRLYTTEELVTWFGHITDAAEELRDEFELMASSGGTPRDYGLKVQSHPVLMVTSPLKMRASRNLMLSFSGELLETVSLLRDKQRLQSNMDAARNLIADLGAGEDDPVRKRGDSTHRWRGRVWDNVAARKVLTFLAEYRTHDRAHKVHSALIAQFVESMVKIGQLTQWTVAVIGGGQTKAAFDLGNGLWIDPLKRQNQAEGKDEFSIGRLLSPRDEAIDLGDEEWQAALDLTRKAWRVDPGRSRGKEDPKAPSGPAIRRVRGFGTGNTPGHPERGLLLIYFLDPTSSGLEKDLPSVVALGLSFPSSDAGQKVEYRVNNVHWESEYGPAE